MKSNKQEYYKMRRPDGEVFEIKHNLVEDKKSDGYELVDEEPVTRETNTSAFGSENTRDEPDKTEEEDGSEEEDKDPEEMSYNDLQSFVSANTEDYNVVGKPTDELAKKAKEIV